MATCARNGDVQDIGIGPRKARAIVLGPVAIASLVLLFMALPATREAARWALQENRPVELATFAFLLAGAARSLRLAWQTRGMRAFIPAFYGLFGLALLFVALEEVAWGQWFFPIETPDFLRGINAQGEFTFHNVEGLQGHSEYFRLVFGLGGLVGVWAGTRPALRAIGAPRLLLSWFVVIAGAAALDLANDHLPIHPSADRAINKFSEAVELLVGMAGWLFVWLNGRRLASRSRP